MRWRRRERGKLETMRWRRREREVRNNEVEKEREGS